MIPPLCIETEVPADELIVSHTDLAGRITYVNETFALISGYTVEELIGAPHALVRHPDMPSSLFANLWETINDNKLWSGYVKNLRKDGGFYWVFAQVSPLLDKDGQKVGYKSLRAPVERAKRHELEQSYARLKERYEGVVKLSEWVRKESYEHLQTYCHTHRCTISEALSRLG